MAVPARKKPLIQVTSCGDIADADFSGLAELLLQVDKKHKLKLIENEQKKQCHHQTTSLE